MSRTASYSRDVLPFSVARQLVMATFMRCLTARSTAEAEMDKKVSRKANQTPQRSTEVPSTTFICESADYQEYAAMTVGGSGLSFTTFV